MRRPSTNSTTPASPPPRYRASARTPSCTSAFARFFSSTFRRALVALIRAWVPSRRVSRGVPRSAAFWTSARSPASWDLSCWMFAACAGAGDATGRERQDDGEEQAHARSDDAVEDACGACHAARSSTSEHLGDGPIDGLRHVVGPLRIGERETVRARLRRIRAAVAARGLRCLSGWCRCSPGWA